MQWSLRIGRVNGVPVEAHWLLALLVGWVAYAGWDRGGWAGLLGSTGLLVGAFASVLVHEIAHTLQAQAINYPVRRIVLWPFGGLALLGRLPERPRDELRIALAGPLVNLGLGLIFAGLTGIWFSTNLITSAPRFELQLVLLRGGPPIPYGLVMLALTNFGLALFNLVPAFPFDGARVLRSLLALVLARRRATRVVASLGWAIGLLCLLAGAALARGFGSAAMVTTLLIGITALLGTSAEEMAERQRLMLRGIPVRAAVRQPTWTLAPGDPLTPALAAVLKPLGHWPLLPVLEEARVVGLLPQRSLAAALAQPGLTTVAEVMLPPGARLEADTDLWSAQQALEDAAHDALPVYDGEQLHGMLTAADIRATLLEPSAMLRIQPSQLIAAGQTSL
jgi:Zn-dependent protease